MLRRRGEFMMNNEESRVASQVSEWKWFIVEQVVLKFKKCLAKQK